MADSTAQDVQPPAIGELLAAANTTVRDLIAACGPDDPLHAGLRQVQRTMERLSLFAGTPDALRNPGAARATPLELNSVVQEMTPALQRLLGPFIALETKLFPPGLWVAIDRSQLEQVALGLVINAREALPLGGTVRVETRHRILSRPAQFRVGSLPPGRWATLEVHDNGAAVDERSIRRLLDRSASASMVDSALSLSAVAAVVRGVGGQMVLEMPAGGGAILAACLPLVAPRRPRLPATGTANAILIVDKDEWSRVSAARALRHAGFGVLEASQPEDALELLDDVAGSCVRLVLADATMLASGPHLLGAHLREQRPEVDLLVTVSHRSSTGHSDYGAVLTKPFSAEDLLLAVQERLVKAR